MSALAIIGRQALAEPWSIEPRLGISAEYDSNPVLRQFNPSAEAHIAALADLPLRYDADDIELLIKPSGRFSNNQGYSSLASNYAHLDSAAQFTNDLGSTTLTAGLARDSSLYYLGALVNGVGVRRDTESIAGDWIRSITERFSTELDASWSHVRYDEPETLTALVDYRYLSAGPTVSYLVTERDTVKLLGTYGDYQSLDGVTESKSKNLQLGYVRQLSEIWTLSTSAGYSRSKNSEKVFFGPFYLGTIQSDQDGVVYSATVSRKSEVLSLTGGVSRALQPTGFAYLSRQDTVTLGATYNLSERWDFAAAALWQRAVNPDIAGRETVLNGDNTITHYVNASLTANWHWTEHWTLSMYVTRITQQYAPGSTNQLTPGVQGPPTISSASTGLNVNLIRQFNRTPF